MSKTRLRNLLIGIVAVFVLVAFLDSLSLFDDKSWIEIPHGSHSHFVPKDYEECVPPFDVSGSTQTKPGPGQTVDCSGNIVPEPIPAE